MKLSNSKKKSKYLLFSFADKSFKKLFDKSFNEDSKLSLKIFSFSLSNIFNSLFKFFFNFSTNSFLFSSSIKSLFKKSLIYFLYSFFVKFLTFFAKFLSFLFKFLKFLISSENLSVKFFVFLIHSFCTTYFHVVSITGIAPLLIESKICCIISISIFPFKALL